MSPLPLVPSPIAIDKMQKPGREGQQGRALDPAVTFVIAGCFVFGTSRLCKTFLVAREACAEPLGSLLSHAVARLNGRSGLP